MGHAPSYPGPTIGLYGVPSLVGSYSQLHDSNPTEVFLDCVLVGFMYPHSVISSWDSVSTTHFSVADGSVWQETGSRCLLER